MKNVFTRLTLAILVLCLPVSSFSQWIPKAIGLLPVGSGISCMSTPTDSVIWAVGVNYTRLMLGNSAANSDSSFLLKSTDGGDTWTFHKIPEMNGSVALDITAIDKNIAFIQSNKEDGNHTYYLHTANGGASWDTIDIGWGKGIFTRAFNDQTVLAWSWAGNGTSISTDQGVNWTNYSSPAFVQNEFPSIENATNAMVTVGSHVWVGTSRRRMYSSADYGQTWDTSTTSLAADRCIMTTAFTDTMNGIAGSSVSSINLSVFANTTLAQTSNGGATWSNIADPPRRISAVVSIPGSFGYYVATGDSGIGQRGSMITRDNGASWIVLDTQNFYSSVIFRDSTHGWAGLGTLATANSPAIYKWSNPAITTGIAPVEVDEKAPIEIFPVPANDEVNLLCTASVQKVSIFNSCGQLLIEQTPQTGVNQTIKLNIAYFPTGIYMIRVITGKGAVTRRIVKN